MENFDRASSAEKVHMPALRNLKRNNLPKINIAGFEIIKQRKMKFEIERKLAIGQGSLKRLR